jgi:hypothetical protein
VTETPPTPEPFGSETPAKPGPAAPPGEPAAVQPSPEQNARIQKHLDDLEDYGKLSEENLSRIENDLREHPEDAGEIESQLKRAVDLAEVEAKAAAQGHRARTPEGTKVGRSEFEEQGLTGRETHEDRVAERRSRPDEWTHVNESLRDPEGRVIRIADKYDAAGNPLPGADPKGSIPDAVDVRRGIVLDDKPLPDSFDPTQPYVSNTLTDPDIRNQMVRYIKAYEIAFGQEPELILIARYARGTRLPVLTERWTPRDFF